MPKSLDDTYKRILREINNPNQVHAYRLLQCLTVASRPLRVEELAEVLAFDLSAEGIPKLNADWRWENQEEAVLLACSSLVSVIIDQGSQVIQFSHFSVKEFLTSDRLASCIMEESQFYISVEPSHTIIAQACLGALLSLNHGTDQYSAWQLPLYGYATTYWVGHAQFGDVESVIKDTLDHFFDMDKPHFSAWFRREFAWELSTGSEDEVADVPPSVASLYFAAWRGFYGLVERLLIKNPRQIHHVGGRFGTPLYASLEGGHIEVAQLLLAHGAGINSRSQAAHDCTPLHFASAMGHLKIVEWLLNHGADVNSQEARGHSPLHLSAIAGHLDISRMLIEHGAMVDIRAKTGSTPLLEACKEGHRDVIWLLLGHNPDVNVCDSADRGYTPLHYAAMREPLNLVQKLLELNAALNSRTDHKCTPLHLATWRGRNDVVQLLLHYNAHWYFHAQNDDGDTVLHKAVEHGRVKIARMLLDRGAEVNFQNTLGFTPLHQAVRGFRSCTDTAQALDMVQLLLDYGADVYMRSSNGKTACGEAYDLGPGQHEIVRLLSYHVAKVSKISFCGMNGRGR